MVTVTIHVPYTRDKTTEAQGGTQPGLVVPGLNPSVECMCQTTAPRVGRRENDTLSNSIWVTGMDWYTRHDDKINLGDDLLNKVKLTF